jgi:septum formation inhibitor-activating ATPase MinD
MADAKQNTNKTTEETAERVRELNERIIDASNRGGQVYLDAYERTLKSIADFEERVAGASQVEWITTIANAQANLTRELAEAYTQAGRDVLK